MRYAAGTTETRRAAIRQSAGVALEQRLTLPAAELVSTGPSTLGGAARRLREQRGVLTAEPNHYLHLTSACPVPSTPIGCLPTSPGDPRFSFQYGLYNTGQTITSTAGLADADVDAPEAWNITQGDPKVIVAVTDTGVAYDNPDLKARIWVNTKENPTNKVDDDHNGYIDDWHGWDFAGPTINTSTGDNDPMDSRGHGTHVAGIISATGNNGLGTRGIAWKGTIMPVRALGWQYRFTDAEAASALRYAAANGARIVNLSWEALAPAAAMKSVIDSYPNVLFVAAADNNTQSLDAAGVERYPCEYTSPNIICVAATDNRDRLATFSNWSAKSVDLGAPGWAYLSNQPSFKLVWNAGGFDATDPFSGFLTKGASPAGTPNTWGRTTTNAQTAPYAITDSPSGPYPANRTTWVQTTKPVSLAGQHGCQLQYYMTHLLASGSRAYTQARRDASFLTNPLDFGQGDTVDVRTGNGTKLRRWVEMSEFDGGSVYIRWGLVAGANTSADGVYIDSPTFYCESPIYSPTAVNELSYESGTSMSAPMVSGVAALVLARYPTATAAQIKERILRSVDLKTALTGKTVTGGRLNAYKALAESDVSVASGVLRVTSGDGETNDVRITAQTGSFLVEDPYSTATNTAQGGSRLNPGAGCTRVTDTSVRCSSTAVKSIVAAGGDLTDKLTLTGIKVPVTYTGFESVTRR